MSSTTPSARIRPGRDCVVRSAAIALGLLVLLLAALFVANGTRDAWRTPEIEHGPGPVASGTVREVRVLALNAAKCAFHRGGLDFASVEDVRSQLDRIATVLRAEAPDVVFLSEVVVEAGPVPVDQVEHLARASGFARYTSCENYSFGLPFYRIRSGNAVLSRFDVRAAKGIQLAGARPFWSPTNNRRALFFELSIDGAWLLAGSIRNDSFDLANNLQQTEEILDFVGARPALLAGDFNAEPATPSIRRLVETGRFTPPAEAPPTYPAHAPTRRIDQVLAPVGWTLVEHHVVDTGVSDHLAVVAMFTLE